MSLLMDALKKAEQEKKEAARRLKEAQEKSGGPIKLQDDDTNKPSDPDSTKTNAEEKVDLTSAEDTEKKTAEELSLSPLDETSAIPVVDEKSPDEKAEEINLEPALELKKDVTINHPEIPELDDDTDFDQEIIAPSGKEKTFAIDSLSVADATTEPFDDTAASVTSQEKYADTMSDSRISRSIVSAADLVRDMGSGKEVPTPVAAQTVFRASVRTSGKQQILEWGMFIGLLTVILVAAGTFYYLKITPLTPETSSPMVAKGVEAEIAPAISVPVPEEMAGGDIAGEITSEDNLAMENNIADTTESQGVAEQTGLAGDDVLQASEETTIDTPELIVGQETEIEEPVIAKAEVPTSQNETRGNVLPDKIQVAPEAIAISRSKSVDKRDQLINSAYSSYVAGNYSQADSLYRDALKESPGNRDALLGIAAIAYRKGNLKIAYQNYLEVLRLYPKDIVAKTALLSLQDNSDPVQSESIIKLMIQQSPGSAFLYFSLGNVYARQSRWADAQQAFFEAYRLQPENSDYAYNLAVSLDHIGQAKAARDYYAVALELADESAASFNTASVMARLNSLSSISHVE